MRKLCPVCNSPKRNDSWSIDFVVPDGWENPTHNLVCLCECGMIYYDNDKTQEDYDLYYKNRYGNDGVLTNKATHKRLRDLAKLAREIEPNKDACIVDFGGGDGYLERQLKKHGYTNVQTVEVGDTFPESIDLLIASHILEHLYNLRGIMDILVGHIKGKFLIDLPNAETLSRNPPDSLPILDFHQKHVNHFSIYTLNLLFRKYGYFLTRMEHYMEHAENLRAIYEKEENYAESLKIYLASKERVEKSISEKEERLKKITFPVIIWGCGDICMTMLKRVPLNVIYYVDNDSAFKGQTIGGIPVLDRVESNEPIVIIAQMQQSLILERIKNSGLKNEVIII